MDTAVKLARHGLQPSVSVAWLKKDTAPDKKVFQQMIEQATDFSWLSPGDTVLVKLSLNSGQPYPAVSDPWTVECLVQILRERGAGKVLVGDQSGVSSVYWTKDVQRGSSRACCASAGLLSVIENSGAEPCFFEERGYDSYIAACPVGLHHWKEPVYITNVVNEVDHIIYLPRVSSHIFSDITSGFKLAVGFLREDSRQTLHSAGVNFLALYEEINEIPEIKTKLRLAISSGRSVITFWGPNRGYITQPEYGAVFASASLLAHELFAYAWLQYNREKLMPAYLYQLDKGVRSLVNIRAWGNRFFVDRIWRPRQTAPDIPAYQAGNIYRHPAVVNSLRRLAGAYSNVVVKETAPHPDKPVWEYVQRKLADFQPSGSR
ncbi:MAG: hypothetical protein H6Q65_2720 [Firmicutes bacterium]|nr:hypothetical protein [Bacillota bacterium]